MFILFAQKKYKTYFYLCVELNKKSMSQQIKSNIRLLWKDCKTWEDKVRWLIRNDYLYRFWHEIKILRRGGYPERLEIGQKLDKFVKNEHPKIAAQKAETVKNAVKINVKKSYLCGHPFRVKLEDGFMSAVFYRNSKTKTIQIVENVAVHREAAILGDGILFWGFDNTKHFLSIREIEIDGNGLR